MKYRMSYILTLLLILSSITSYALNDSLNSKYGAFGGLNFNIHEADFFKLYGIPNCCPAFESGFGIGLNAGFLYEHSFFNDFWFGSRLAVMSLDGELIKEERTTIIIKSGPIQGIFEHKLNADFLNIGFEPYISYNLFGEFFISAGARLGFNVIQDYKQIETITEPPGLGTFLDSNGNDSHSRTRNASKGEIPKAIPFQAALIGSISYELPLNAKGNMLLAPEISYYLPVTELVENTDWKVSTLRVGIAFKFVPEPKPAKEEIFRKEMFIDTIKIENKNLTENKVLIGMEKRNSQTIETDSNFITIEKLTRTDTLLVAIKYKLDGSIVIVGVDESGNEIPNPKFKIEEFITHRFDPLLNYIFFENNSALLPSKYITLKNNETDKFEIDSLYSETPLEIYYNILNIIGKRMLEYKDANITLIGCNSNIGDEKDNLELSQNRAEAVKDYLVNIWKIKPNRIKLVKRNQPEKPTIPLDEADKIRENARVEIYFDNDKILEPVYIEKVDLIANPSIARFKVESYADAGLASWVIEGYQSSSSDVKYIIDGKSQFPEKVDWELNKFLKLIPKMPEPLIYSLKLEDKKGNNKVIDNKTSPIEVITIEKKRIQHIGDYEIQRYSLILFDFDKSVIEGDNKKIIDIISKRIKPESEIEISGYTDRTGEADYNKKLSERRALATRSALKMQEAKAAGIGEDELLYDNDTPEGRFYCRTVNIIIKTPIKKSKL